MHRPTRLKLTDINQHLTCILCDGYLIDATTIVECLHSFCRTCIVRYLENSRFCPVCDVQVHKTKPLQSLRSDKSLQDIVYKLIPGLYNNEMHRRREFYAEHPDAAQGCSSEEKGEGAGQRCFYSPEETISLTLMYFDGATNQESEPGSDVQTQEEHKIVAPKDIMTRHLNCPAAMSVAQLKKFIRMKFAVPLSIMIKIMYSTHLLSDHYSLVDIAYIYSWRRAGPMKFYYTFVPLKIFPKNAVDNSETMDVCSSSDMKIEETEETRDVDEPVSEPVISVRDLSSESNKCLESRDECEKMDIGEECTASIASENSRMSSSDDVVSDSSRSTSDAQQMDTAEVETTVKAPPSVKDSLHPTDVPSPTTLKVVPATDMTNTGGLKLKLIHCPDPPMRANSSKKRGGRRPRYKSAPVQRFPRLAPYPPPPGQPITNTSILPQLAMGKLVPSLAPNLVTALVSSTVNTACNASKSSMVLSPASFMTKPAAVVPREVTRTPESFTSVSNGVTDSSTSVSSTSSLPASSFPSYVNGLPTTHVITIPTVNSPVNIVPQVCNGAPLAATSDVTTTSVPQPKNVVVDSASTATSTTANGDAVTASQDSSINVSVLETASPTASETSSSKDVSQSAVPSATHPSEAKSVVEPDTPSSTEAIPNSVSKLQNADSDKQSQEKETSECNGVVSSKDRACNESFTANKKNSDAFKLNVKNSISAEFSDNDDGCQPDLVVDEQKMDSSDNEEDADLRKKITAIAEKEDEDTEADSGRASGVSNQDRSSCDDDIDTPMIVDTTSTTSSATSGVNGIVTTTAASTTAPDTRHAKSNNINHVINNLLRHHEKKDTIGALDLSTCLKKPSNDLNNRVKPVANPVLDHKHRQQPYLPAPSNPPPAKQHTACPPAPKHPTSSPILLQGLTSGIHPNLLPHRKSPHLPVPSFQHMPHSYPSQSKVPVPSGLGPGRPSHNYIRTLSSPVPSSHIPNSFKGAVPCRGNTLYALSPNPGAMSPRLASTLKPISSPTPSLFNKLGNSSYSKPDKSRKLDSSPKSIPISPNRNSIMSPSNMTTQASYPKSPSSARLSPHHKSASPAPSPKSPSTTTSSSSASSPSVPSTSSSSSSVPSNSVSSSSVPSSSSTSPPSVSSSYRPSIPIYKKSSEAFKSYKFKNSGNLAVINPDPNGYRQKIVIRNLDVRPKTPQSQRL